MIYEKLAAHVGHEVECVSYGGGENVAVECIDCGCIIVDANREDEDQ